MALIRLVVLENERRGDCLYGLDPHVAHLPVRVSRPARRRTGEVKLQSKRFAQRSRLPQRGHSKAARVYGLGRSNALKAPDLKEKTWRRKRRDRARPWLSLRPLPLAAGFGSTR